MPSLEFVTVDVFTQTRFKGNPLAIVTIPSGLGISTPTLQAIAREFNLSETVVLYESLEATADIPAWTIRIFMTEAELPFAGHPTIGTACHVMSTLAPGKSRAVLHCKAGPIEIEYANGVSRASIPHNVHVHIESPFTGTEVETLQPKLKGTELLNIATVSPVKGMNFIYIQLPDLEALALVECTGLKPAPTLDSAWNVGFCGSVFYVLGERSTTPGRAVKQSLRMRMIEGILEDPATGSAACGLAAFLAVKGGDRNVDFEMIQGVEMGRQSDIGVAVTLDRSAKAAEKIVLIGSAVKVMEGRVEYD
ncbi:hypothetical protein B0A48_17846 [Cryoendolithus antarcticus]|uniref:Phenazine biosynthesis protein n=1 Tax=Cryoendolithus antarcticus TaxID=1507870 RepID=A0A1V8SA83_9PEZI|nr:hypothetical protein B0A48_17846 [Cryoendolithus antarcticus]